MASFSVDTPYRWLTRMVEPMFSRRGRWAWALMVGLGLFTLSSCARPEGDRPSELEQQVLEIIRNNPEVILESVQNYQEQQRQQQQQSQQQSLQSVITAADFLEGAPQLGAEEGSLMLVEFSDFECPFCQKVVADLKTFVDKNQAEITLAYKHLPLDQIHDEATPAASAAWAAQQQGQFWPYHDRLFENQARLGEALYREIAQDLGLDLAQFDRDRQSDTAKAAIRKDLTTAQQLQLNGTPTFILFPVANPEKAQVFSGALTVSQFEEVLQRVK